MTKPLLSICIPTYNRAEYLEKSLESLVSQPEFAQIEVVISDNASTDNTEEVCRSYQKKYPNIVYFRNEENIHDRNFPTALMRANGIYRKLYNDNMIYLENSICYLLNLITSCMNDRPFLFFLHGRSGPKRIKNAEKIEVKTLDELIAFTSHHFTWLSGFGFWEDDCRNLEVTFSQCDTHIWQTYKGLELASSRRIVIFTKKMIEPQYVQKKDFSYGLYTVFFKNFLNMLDKYVKAGLISLETIATVRKHMLYTLAGGWIGSVKNEKYADIGNEKNYMQLIFEDYKNESYFSNFLKWNFIFCILKSKYFCFLKKTIFWKRMRDLKNQWYCTK